MIVARRRIALFSFTLILAGASVAHADDKTARADALFNEGQALLQRGNIAEACGKIEASYAIEPAQGTLLNLAYCHEKQGRVGLSYREYRRALARAEREFDTARARFASGKATELEPRLVRIEWQLPAGASLLAVAVDGDAMAGDPNRVFVEPGKHVIEATTIQGKQEKIVNVPALPTPPLVVSLVQPKVAAPPPVVVVKNDTAVVQQTPDDPSTTTKKIVGWSVIGVGAAALGLGTGFGIGTFSEKSSASDTCQGDLCDAAGLEHGNRAHAFATVSTVAFAVGAVAIGVGTYLLLTANSGSSASAAASLRQRRSW